MIFPADCVGVFTSQPVQGTEGRLTHNLED